jgi:hypothetical protein
MKTTSILLALAAPILLFSACDNITGLDNVDPPTSTLTGRVVYQNEVIGVRNNGVQLELWEPAYFEKYGQLTKIQVNIKQDGTFSSVLYDGTYKLNLLPNNGPWVNSSDTTLIVLNGSANVDFAVRPYYTVITPTYTRGAATTAAPGGTVTGTFKVGKIDTSRAVEYVGLYIGTTWFVDRTNSVAIANAQRERTGAAIASNLTANSDIAITVTLPPTIYDSNSPWRRDFVYARIGVKTSGVTEMLFSQPFEVRL